MIIRIIDIGSNSVKASTYSVESGKHRLAAKQKLDYSLGNAVFPKGSVPDSGVGKISAFIKDVPRTPAGEKPHFTFILATSAVRSAQNRDDFTRRLAEETGYPVRVLSGAEESYLIHTGIIGQAGAKQGEVIKSIDIGGGSAEVSWSRGEDYLFGKSYELGAIRVARRFFDGKTITRDVVQQVHDHAMAELRANSPANAPVADRAIGSSGNLRAINAMMRKMRGTLMAREIPALTPGSLEDLIELTIGRTPGELASLFGIDPERSRIITPALVVLLTCLRHFDIRRLEITDSGLREGTARFWSMHGHLNLPVNGIADEMGPRKAGKS